MFDNAQGRKPRGCGYGDCLELGVDDVVGSGGGCFVGTATASISNKGLHANQGNENPSFSLISVLVAVIARVLMGRLRAVERVYINGKFDWTLNGKRMMNGARQPGSLNPSKRQ